MTEERLAHLEVLCQEATEGPWHARHRHVGNVSNDFAWDESAGLGWEIEELDRPMRGQFVRGADAHFIAEARTALPEALAEVRRLREALEDIASVHPLPLTGEPTLYERSIQSGLQAAHDKARRALEEAPHD
ncbi:hypothetical protein [Sulfobacillus harzensis]|uniref:Uncharacterized protein n=1 Tax=Sulfobacillus harzensis TaxID=2729629 RepID=A0A7Y0Q5X2_9FIRM|nr:hypothetical protein [Sulfobacillus harzensis]NMP24754.1 hypothetical protein [Sulfobacillus harzensis]